MGGRDGVRRLHLVDVEEPWAADVLELGGVVLMPEGFPKRGRRLEQAGFAVRSVDVSELQKAEAGVTCMSILSHVRPAGVTACPRVQGRAFSPLQRQRRCRPRLPPRCPRVSRRRHRRRLADLRAAPAELAVHPGDGSFTQRHAERTMPGAILYLMCDDLTALISSLAVKNVLCTAVEDARSEDHHSAAQRR